MAYRVLIKITKDDGKLWWCLDNSGKFNHAESEQAFAAVANVLGLTLADWQIETDCVSLAQIFDTKLDANRTIVRLLTDDSMNQTIDQLRPLMDEAHANWENTINIEEVV